MTLEVVPTASSSPVELAGGVLYSGRVMIRRPGTPMVKRGEPAQPFGFFVPDVPPLAPDDPVPTVVPEAWLMCCRSSNNGNTIGIEEFGAVFQPDPRGGTAQWLEVSGTAHAGFPISVGYRVLVVSQMTGNGRAASSS